MSPALHSVFKTANELRHIDFNMPPFHITETLEIYKSFKMLRCEEFKNIRDLPVFLQFPVYSPIEEMNKKIQTALNCIVWPLHKSAPLKKVAILFLQKKYHLWKANRS